MNNFLFAVNIWIKTILINMVLIGLGLILSRSIDGLPGVFVLLIIAVLFTAPLLIIITQAVRISTRIPYGWQAKLAWLVFVLSLVSIIFYALIGLPIDTYIFQKKSDFDFFMLATIISIVGGALLSRKSFRTLCKVKCQQQMG